MQTSDFTLAVPVEDAQQRADELLALYTQRAEASWAAHYARLRPSSDRERYIAHYVQTELALRLAWRQLHAERGEAAPALREVAHG